MRKKILVAGSTMAAVFIISTGVARASAVELAIRASDIHRELIDNGISKSQLAQVLGVKKLNRLYRQNSKNKKVPIE